MYLFLVKDYLSIDNNIINYDYHMYILEFKSRSCDKNLQLFFPFGFKGLIFEHSILNFNLTKMTSTYERNYTVH